MTYLVSPRGRLMFRAAQFASRRRPASRASFRPTNRYLELSEQLGFSLRPPKWLRKAQPGKILKKVAIPLAIGASLFIPGVAPAALAVLKGTGRFALTGGKKLVGFAKSHANLIQQGIEARQSAAAAQTPAATAAEMLPVSLAPTESFAAAAGGGGGYGGGYGGGAPDTGESTADPSVALRTAGQAAGPAALVIGGLVVLALAASRRR